MLEYLKKLKFFEIKGNAGLAAAYSGQTLKIKTTIVTPNTTGIRVIDDLKYTTHFKIDFNDYFSFNLVVLYQTLGFLGLKEKR